MKKQNHSRSQLFNDSDTTSGAYYNLCNHPRCTNEKQFIENLWNDFQIYAGKQFKKEFKTEIYSRYWEMRVQFFKNTLFGYLSSVKTFQRYDI